METTRTSNGLRQRIVCYLGELNSSAQARWLKTIEVFNEQGEAQQLKLFPSHIEPPVDDADVARVLVNRVRLERTRQFGACFLGWELWKRLALDRFFEQAVDDDAADVPWSRVAALLAINRLCAPGSELAIEERWYPSTALDDLLEIEEGKSTTRFGGVSDGRRLWSNVSVIDLSFPELRVCVEQEIACGDPCGVLYFNHAGPARRIRTDFCRVIKRAGTRKI